MMLMLADFQAAQQRINARIRRTPLLHARPTKRPVHEPLYLKLEYMQITGSFKARGALNKLYSLAPDQLARGLVAASGGNHGLGVAYAGWLAQCPVTIYLGHNTPAIKTQKLEAWGAKVIFEGAVWDDANRAALQAAERDGLTYVHPFADPAIIAGQGTVALEMLEEQPDLDVLLVAIGGGGLISGVSLAAKALNPRIKIIGVEPTGAPTLHASWQAGKVIELDAIHTVANTLAPRMSAQLNFDIIREHVSEIVLVSDAEMREAAQWLWEELAIAAELSGSAAMAALLTGKVQVAPDQKVGVLVCGAGSDGLA